MTCRCWMRSVIQQATLKCLRYNYLHGPMNGCDLENQSVLSMACSTFFRTTFSAACWQMASMAWWCIISCSVGNAPFFFASSSLATWTTARLSASSERGGMSVARHKFGQLLDPASNTANCKSSSIGAWSSPVVVRQKTASETWCLMPARRIILKSILDRRSRQRARRLLASARIMIRFKDKRYALVVKRVPSNYCSSTSTVQTITRHFRCVVS